jgi:uncharacterized protein (DUF983 family)
VSKSTNILGDSRGIFNYPEVEEEPHMSGIYSHICPECSSGFLGYKKRVVCFKCESEGGEDNEFKTRN